MGEGDVPSVSIVSRNEYETFNIQYLPLWEKSDNVLLEIEYVMRYNLEENGKLNNLHI